MIDYKKYIQVKEIIDQWTDTDKIASEICELFDTPIAKINKVETPPILGGQVYIYPQTSPCAPDILLPNRFTCSNTTIDNGSVQSTYTN